MQVPVLNAFFFLSGFISSSRIILISRRIIIIGISNGRPTSMRRRRSSSVACIAHCCRFCRSANSFARFRSGWAGARGTHGGHGRGSGSDGKLRPNFPLKKHFFTALIFSKKKEHFFLKMQNRNNPTPKPSATPMRTWKGQFFTCSGRNSIMQLCLQPYELYTHITCGACRADRAHPNIILQ